MPREAGQLIQHANGVQCKQGEGEAASLSGLGRGPADEAPHLAGLVSAGRQHPVAILVPLRLHDGALVAVQGAQVAPCFGAPQLYQPVFAACR